VVLHEAVGDHELHRLTIGERRTEGNTLPKLVGPPRSRKGIPMARILEKARRQLGRLLDQRRTACGGSAD
jgi:hypothetical protein